MPPDTLQQTDLLIVPAADTLPAPVCFALDTAADYPFTVYIHKNTLNEAAVPTQPEWMSGLEPEPRAMYPGSRSSFILIIVILLIMVIFNHGTLRRLLSFSFDELVSVRHGRDNVFDERPAALSVIQAIMTMVFVVCGGFLLAGGVASRSAGLDMLDTTMLMGSVGLVLGYYLVGLAAYSVVGFTFTTDEGRREWMRGFNASISLLALALLVPTFIGVFYPATVFAMSILALILFITAKVMFILKGFRIFFDNFFSLLYFILYLCTLEIIPIILVYNCSVVLLK